MTPPQHESGELQRSTHTAASAHVLTSLYPLGMVPEISSVDVRQPAGQYLLRRRREAHGEWGWAVADTSTKLQIFT